MKCIPLGHDRYAIVDDDDYDYLMQWPWNYSEGGRYVRRTDSASNDAILMHRVIMNAPADKQIDHINRDRLDNQKSNLRIATNSQNAHNQGKRSNRSSQYIGVGIHRSTGKWQAYITINQKMKSLGLHSDEKQAAIVRDQAARELFGDFANLNFPNG